MKTDCIGAVLSIRHSAVLAQTWLRPTSLHLIEIRDLLGCVTRHEEHLLVHVEGRIPSTTDRGRREMLNLSAILACNNGTVPDILHLGYRCYSATGQGSLLKFNQF